MVVKVVHVMGYLRVVLYHIGSDLFDHHLCLETVLVLLHAIEDLTHATQCNQQQGRDLLAPLVEPIALVVNEVQIVTYRATTFRGAMVVSEFVLVRVLTPSEPQCCDQVVSSVIVRNKRLLDQPDT